MDKWITTWPNGQKWGSCCPSLAVQIVAEGKFQVRLVSANFKITRHILQTPRWAQTLQQRAPAVALARRLSPLDAYRAEQAQRRCAA